MIHKDGLDRDNNIPIIVAFYLCPNLLLGQDSKGIKWCLSRVTQSINYRLHGLAQHLLFLVNIDMVKFKWDLHGNVNKRRRDRPKKTF
jgi:hypothetical protein